MKVTASVRRVGGWRAVQVPALPGLFTQARRLDQVPAMVEDAARTLGLGPVEVEVEPQAGRPPQFA